MRAEQGTSWATGNKASADTSPSPDLALDSRVPGLSPMASEGRQGRSGRL